MEGPPFGKRGDHSIALRLPASTALTCGKDPRVSTQAMTDLTERLLADAGGWQAMKEARALCEMDRVTEAAWVDPLLQGRVRAGELEYRAGLRILSKSNVENLCTCRDSRQRGMICAHSLAVGLAVLKPRPAAKPAAIPVPVAEKKGAALQFAEEGELLELAIVFGPNLPAAWEKNSVTVIVEAVVAGKRGLLSAVDPKRRYRASEVDQRLIGQIVAASGGELPGMLMLPRVMFGAFLGALAGHPRVTIGRGPPLEIANIPIPRPTSFVNNSHLLQDEHECWLLNGNCLTPLITKSPDKTANDSNRVTLIQPGLAPEFFLKIEGSLNHLAAELESKIGERRTTLSASGIRAGHPAEQAAIQRLLDAGFSAPNQAGQFILKGEPSILGFFATELPRLQKMWKVTIGERFAHVTRDVERVAPRFEVKSSGETWFDLSVNLETPSGDRFSASDIQRLLQSGQRSIRMKNQKLAIFDTALLDDFREVLRDCDPAQRELGLYRIDAKHAGYLAEFANEQGALVGAPQKWKAWTMGASGKNTADVALGTLENVLRPYQKAGVNWLNQLISNGWSGLLADEMGLGKTVQMLALIRSLRGKHLVVCPSSLVFNWQREAQRFAPEMKAIPITGSDRATALRQPADLYITSYPLLRRDADLYRNMEFETVVLDEAQHIKNPDSQNSQAALSLKSRYRFAMTGTPIENSIRDIWSLMHFLMPGYLGKRDDFKERYQREIENEPGGPTHRRLIKRLRPFILRRTKRDVLTELPDKIEQVAYCELSIGQRELYSQLTGSARRQLSELAGAKDQNRARMTMLTALLRLRQACCDERLLKPDDEPKECSGKVEMLIELIEEALDGGHPVLVFSQFATMLRLLRETLNAAEIATCYLDGQTKNRAHEVDRFQAGDAQVFLISLKAGGTGLNLTAADTVIHFDPWWNPAVEAQATDRAHRIGQQQVVTSYKLIARDTVEEKILALQQRKKAIIAASLESEEPLMEALSMDEIRDLLE